VQEGPDRVQERPGRSRLPLIGLLVGLWAIVPPYIVLFGRLQVRAVVELVDHAVPGAVVIAVAALASVQLRSARPSQLLLFAGGAVITLAGFWMLTTHLGLVGQARQGLVSGGAVAWHGLPGVAVMVLGLSWTARFSAADDEASPDP